MIVYWIIVISVLVLGIYLPQDGPDKKQYVRIMFLLHTFVCGCKTEYLTGDLMKYNYTYSHTYAEQALFSSYFLGRWKNALWAIFNKVVGILSGYNFNVFLIIVAIITEFCVARFILKFSPRPWFSYLVWNCLSLYYYGFHQIKQGLAMAILLLATEALLEHRKKMFYIWTIVAGFTHGPAFAFLPMYQFTKRKVNKGTLLTYIAVGGVAFFFRKYLVRYMANFYYDESTANNLISGEADTLGLKFFVILSILFVGLVIKGLQDEIFRKLFLLIGVAAVLQTGAIYDNIFTRYADYFLQFAIVYIPLLCYDRKGATVNKDTGEIAPVFQLDDSSRDTFIIGVVIILLTWFYLTVFHGVSATEVDSFLKYKFFWQA